MCACTHAPMSKDASHAAEPNPETLYLHLGLFLEVCTRFRQRRPPRGGQKIWESWPSAIQLAFQVSFLTLQSGHATETRDHNLLGANRADHTLSNDVLSINIRSM